MQIVASVATYAELRDVLRERQLELGLSSNSIFSRASRTVGPEKPNARPSAGDK